jgi:hypothetical protein
MLKKLFSFAFIVFIVISTVIAQSQEVRFRVLGKKGDILVKNDKTKKSVEVKIGDKLFYNDKIIMPTGAYIGLVYNNGKTIELKEAGTYKVSMLSSQAEGIRTSVLPKIANMIFMSIMSNEDLLSQNAHHSQMQSGGYTERGIGEVSLTVISPSKTHLMEPIANFCWNSYPGNSEYEFNLSNRFNKVIFTKALSDTCINIDASSLKLEHDTYYFWTVSLKSNPDIKSHEACFKILDDKEAEMIKDTLKQLRDELGREESAASKIVYAFFYEQNNLFDDASHQYKEAMKMAPDVYDYVVLYENFLKRTQMPGK